MFGRLAQNLADSMGANAGALYGSSCTKLSGDDAETGATGHRPCYILAVYLSRQRLFHIGQGVGQHGHGGGIFAKFTGNDLVERVGGGMVVIEVGSAVLHHAKGRHSKIRHGGDVRAGRISAGLEDGGADALEHALHRPQSVDGRGSGFNVKAERMGSAGVALDGGDVVGEVGRVFDGVGLAARASGFFVYPGDDPEGSSGAKMKALEDFGSLHGDDDARSIVDCPGSEVPGIEMSGDDDDLLRMLGTFQVRNDVVAGFVGELLRSQDEMHADLTLGSEVNDEIGILSRNGSGGDSGRETESGMGKSIVCAADRADQSSHGPEIRGSLCSSSTVADGVRI